MSTHFCNILLFMKNALHFWEYCGIIHYRIFFDKSKFGAEYGFCFAPRREQIIYRHSATAVATYFLSVGTESRQRTRTSRCQRSSASIEPASQYSNQHRLRKPHRDRFSELFDKHSEKGRRLVGADLSPAHAPVTVPSPPLSPTSA